MYLALLGGLAAGFIMGTIAGVICMCIVYAGREDEDIYNDF